MASPFLSLPGAVSAVSAGPVSTVDEAGAGPDTVVPANPVALHYGAPLHEQRALAEGNAVVDLSNNGVLTVSGPDRLSWLGSMTSQQLVGLPAGESTETLLLDANGRIEHAIRLVDDGEVAWLLVDQGSAAPLFAYLNRMRFALRVEVHDVSAEYAAVLAFGGGSAREALHALAPSIVWVDPWAAVSRGGTQYARGGQTDHAGANWSAVQFVFPRASLSAVVDRVTAGDLSVAGTMARDALEIRAWRPSRVGDVDERSIPHELDWMRTAVHLNKGCYRGQETVAKVHNLGHPPRRLVLLHLDGSGGELPTSGALVYKAGEAGVADARPVGRVTRAALHYEWGGIALALLKRAVAEDAELEVRVGAHADDPQAAFAGAVAAAQEIIVPGDAGATRKVPRLKRI